METSESFRKHHEERQAAFDKQLSTPVGMIGYILVLLLGWLAIAVNVIPIIAFILVIIHEVSGLALKLLHLIPFVKNFC